MSLLEVKKLNKYYPIRGSESFHALKDIDLSLKKGELVSIIGESGSGKSTLMNVLGGLDSKYDGDILVDGDNIKEFSEKEMVQYHKEKIGFVFQNFNLIPHLSILDNVTLAMTLSNVDGKTRKERAKEVLEQLGLKEHYKKKPNQLSGGQKQRVAIARALVNDPDIIIADEPTGALDSQTSEQVLEIIKTIAKGGKLVIMVTHSEKVASHSTRVITVDDGRIINDEKRTLFVHQENTFALSERNKNKNLSFFSAIRMALLNMKEKLGRNILIALGGSIGIMSVILMLALGQGVNDYLTDTMNENVNPFISEVKMTEDTIKKENVEKTTGQEEKTLPNGMPGSFAAHNPIVQLTENIAFDEENMDELKKIDHVKKMEAAYTSFSMGSNTVTYDGESYPFMNFGTTSENITEANILYGKLPDLNEILITEGMAESIGISSEEMIGKKMEVNLSVGGGTLSDLYVVSGIYTPGTVIGPAGAFDSVFMSMESFTTLNEKNNREVEPNVVYLTSDNEKNTQTIKDAASSLGYAGSSSDTLAKTFSQMLDIFTYILSGVAGISLFVSAIMILTVLYISVVERTQEIGVIKAIGGRKKDIRRIFVSESFLIGLFSGLLGVGISGLLSIIGNTMVENLFGTTIFHMTPQYAVFGILASVIISMIAGLMPANKAAQLDPIEALRHH